MRRITVGMTAYNSEKFVEDSIKSLLAQTTPDINIVISDDASVDGTEDACRRAMATDPRVHYIRQERNLGPRANFEFVFRQCDTEYFMWASHDDVWSPTFVEDCMAELDANPDCGFVITRWIVESRTIPFLRRYFLPDMDFVTDRDSIRRMMSFTSLPFSSFKDNLTYGIWRQQALSRVIEGTRAIRYFSIGGAANEYALLLYRGCHVKSAYLRKRYKLAPPGSVAEPLFRILSRLRRLGRKSTTPYPRYTPEDHINDLVAVFKMAGLDTENIERAVKLNRLHLRT